MNQLKINDNLEIHKMHNFTEEIERHNICEILKIDLENLTEKINKIFNLCEWYK